MKNFKIFLLLFALAGTVMVTSTSCDKDDGATCSDGIQNGNETGVDCGGDCAACPTCDDGIMNGDETGVDCGGSCDPCPEGVQKTKWQSSGANIALLLAGAPFNVDSIYVEFDLITYRVEQFSGGVMTVLEGNYTQSKSGFGNIWDIILNQSTPSSLTATGIYEISVDGNLMTYEVLQTEPDLGYTPPTAAAGFGSTNGGTFSTWNVQKYEKID
ncbi:MAG: hypothetical protein KDC85_23625 [Saprospiraceae bacterium]|nr:hypothetical protein [Saprospiraceae bacterium]MCB9326008.1 hypothetical protein [Lewinellaceae bacterium]